MFINVDCIELYVDNLDEGITFYCQSLGLKLLWRETTSAGLGMKEGITEVVIQTDRKNMNVDFKVEDVEAALEEYVKAGGEIVCPTFDIPIGKCAVVGDKWGNQYVLLDMTKGTYITDEEGNVIGVSK